VPFGVLSFSYLLFQRKLVNSNINFLNKVIFCIAPWLILLFYMEGAGIMYAHTVESLIAGYYLLFGLSLFSSSIFNKSITTVLCLLSRYSLVLWLPVLALQIAFKGRKKIITFSSMVLAGILCFYVLPFMTVDPSIFMKGYEYHSIAAYKIWAQNGTEVPKVLVKGLGLAGYFFEFLEGNSDVKLTAFRQIHIWSLLVFTFISGLIFWVYKERIRNKNLFLLGTFKIYLTIFYGLIQIPFAYLFLTPIMISLLCCFKVMELKTSFS